MARRDKYHIRKKDRLRVKTNKEKYGCKICGKISLTPSRKHYSKKMFCDKCAKIARRKNYETRNILLMERLLPAEVIKLLEKEKNERRTKVEPKQENMSGM